MEVLEKSVMKVRKISDNIGVEVTGLDLSKPVDAATRKQLHDLVVENVAMVIRDQHLTPEQFQDAAQSVEQTIHGGLAEAQSEMSKIETPASPLAQTPASLDGPVSALPADKAGQPRDAST